MMWWEWLVYAVGGGPVVWRAVTLSHVLRQMRTPLYHTPERPASPLDWCGGCDEIRPPSYMAFTEAGTYRCALCRGEPEPVPPQDASLRAIELSPQIIAGLRAHLKFSPQDREDLIEKWGSSWLPEETHCWDCDQVFDGSVGRCPACTDKYARAYDRCVVCAKALGSIRANGRCASCVQEAMGAKVAQWQHLQAQEQRRRRLLTSLTAIPPAQVRRREVRGLLDEAAALHDPEAEAAARQLQDLINEAGRALRPRPPAGTRITGAPRASVDYTIDSNNKTVTIHDL